jgi:uncharacterized protein YcfJ
MGEARMKNMKKTLLAGALLSSALVPGAVLAQAYGDTARVISATPLYDRVAEPRRECHDEQVTAYEERRSVRPASEMRESGGVGAGTVIGAIVGGVIGHQFGGSSESVVQVTGQIGTNRGALHRASSFAPSSKECKPVGATARPASL